MNFDRIYLDYASTTPTRSEVERAMQETSLRCGFNPSSQHFEGRQARAALDAARDGVAAAIGAGRSEIVFTSGGTEADNLALLGVLRALPRPAHVVVSAVEHHAVLGVLNQLRDEGVETSVVGVDSHGLVDPFEFESALRSHTRLASVMYANNEVGVVQRVADLAARARARGVLFHTDAVAAPCWLPIDVAALGVDLLSLSAHKFYGPRGVGALYVRKGVPIAPAISGGGQESGRRAGTHNLPGIAGMALALDLANREREQAVAAVSALRDRLEAGILERVGSARLNGSGAARLANIANVSFSGVEAAELAIALDLEGIAVAAGAACTSGTVEPSHVLAAMGAGGGEIESGVRFSLGNANTTAQIDRVLAILPMLVDALRSGSIAGGMGRVETNRARLEAEA